MRCARCSPSARSTTRRPPPPSMTFLGEAATTPLVSIFAHYLETHAMPT